MTISRHHLTTTSVVRVSRRGLLGVIGMLLLKGQAMLGADSISKEYQLKAAFLYNFTKFIVWPPKSFAGGKNSLVMGVLGRNPFGDELAEITRKRKVGGREIQVRQVSSVEEAHSVDILFIPAGEEKKLGDQLHALHDSNILTVGESSSFASLGGIITFRLEADKIRFEINLDSSQRAALKISPQLLKLAISVRKTK